MQLTRFKAAIFDLDGTLVLSEPAWEEAKRRVLARIGIKVAQSTYDAFVGRGLRGFLTEVLGSDLPDDQRSDLANQIGAEADILLPQVRQVVPGAAKSVHRLVGAGMRVAICSSSPRRHINAALEQLGIAEHISTIISGAELPRGKPDPLPYMETLRKLGLSADQAYAVEDALPGVLSARGAGLNVIGIGPQARDPAFTALCRWTVSDFGAFDRMVF